MMVRMRRIPGPSITLSVPLIRLAIEIGCLELVSRRPTGRHFHQYLNPERDIDPRAQEIHGLTRARLEPEPKFAQVAAALIEFLRGAELIIPQPRPLMWASWMRNSPACPASR